MLSLVVLDRDGVINQDSATYIRSPEEWIPIPGSLEAIARLNAANIKVMVVTNQSGLARGFFDEATLTAIHQKMAQALAAVGGHVDGVFFCPHHPDDHCDCRKPKTGLFEQIAAKHGDLTDVPVIGDKLSDLEAGLAVGGQPILVRTGQGEETLAAGIPEGVIVYDDLSTAVDALLKIE